MAGNTLRASVELDDGGVTKKLHGISAAFDKVGGKGSGAVFFGSVGAKAVAKGFDLIGASIGGTVSFLTDAFEAAQQDQVSQAALGQALKANIPNWDGNADALNRYIDAQINHGFADDEVRASIGQLVGITHDAQKATELNTIAQELARSKGIDLGTATDIVTKAAQGNGKALKALGIDTTGAKDAMGLLKAITDNTKGSMDAYDATMAGKVNISQKKFDEAMEKIGYTIMPVVSDIMQKFSDDWLPAFGRGWQKVVDAIKAAVTWIGNIIGALNRGIAKVDEFLKKIGILNVHRDVGHDPIGDFLFGGKMPSFANGGIVPGPLNAPVMAVVHGGETIIPNRAGRAGGGFGYNMIHVHFSVDGRVLTDAVSRRLFYDQRRAPPTTGNV